MLATLKLKFVNKSSEILKTINKQLIKKTFYAESLRVVLTSKSLTTLGGKAQTSNLNNSIVVN